MPHHKSAMKRIRQDRKRRSRNKAVKSAVRTVSKQVGTATNDEEAQRLLAEASSVIDRAAKKHVIHWRTAARKKSRLTKQAKSSSS